MTADKKISKTLSFWLRHQPDAAGLSLDSAGWADVDTVLSALADRRISCDWDRLLEVVASNDKQRFELSANACRIRARQGHSVQVNLDLPPTTPPNQLYHGTVERFLPSILAEGLKPMARHHVHLSTDLETATKVAQRRGKPVVLIVNAAALSVAGQEFFVTGNGVWLTANVLPEYLARAGQERTSL